LVGLCRLDYQAAVPGIWLLPLAVLVAVLATKEGLDLAAAAGAQPLREIVYLANIALVMVAGQQFLGFYPSGMGNASLWSTFFWMVLPLAVISLWMGEVHRYRRPGGNLLNLAVGVLAIIYIGVMLGFAVQLRMQWGVGALVSWIIVVKMGDTGAYAVGRLVGRHKLAPALSPGKTVEGAFGALLFACLGSWAAFHWLIPSCVPLPHWVCEGSLHGQITYGLVVGAAGMVGDLAESLLKRDVGWKDSSRWLPGFGGTLDVLDSLLLSAPVAWFFWAYGLVGQ
jgi:phosphatidate cytidylyltransferase